MISIPSFAPSASKPHDKDAKREQNPHYTRYNGLIRTCATDPPGRGAGGGLSVAGSLRQIYPAVYVNGLPRDVPPARRAQQLYDSGDILRLAFAANQRMAAARNDAAPAGVRRARPADAPRRDAIHRDAAAAEFDRQGLGEANEAGLRSRNMSPPRGTSVGGETADIDDGTVALVEHTRNHGAAHQERPVEHHRHDKTPVRKAHGSECVVAANGSVVDEDIDRAEHRRDFVDHAGGLGF